MSFECGVLILLFGVPLFTATILFDFFHSPERNKEQNDASRSAQRSPYFKYRR